jgi:hypothetical protein
MDKPCTSYPLAKGRFGYIFNEKARNRPKSRRAI